MWSKIWELKCRNENNKVKPSNPFVIFPREGVNKRQKAGSISGENIILYLYFCGEYLFLSKYL